MQTRADLVTNLDWLQSIQVAADVAPDAIRSYVQKDLRAFVDKAVDISLRREPGQVVYPIEWASEKQRRAFFATNGFGHGIPYQRTHQFVKGWHVQVDYTDSFSGISLYHDSDIEQFVTGRHQQPFHANTGWPSSADAIQVILLDLDARIEDGLPLVLAEVFGD